MEVHVSANSFVAASRIAFALCCSIGDGGMNFSQCVPVFVGGSQNTSTFSPHEAINWFVYSGVESKQPSDDSLRKSALFIVVIRFNNSAKVRGIESRSRI